MDYYHESIILGAGISGLTCGLYLQQRLHDFLILEKEGRTGGRILSTREQDLLLENGPNAVLIKQRSYVLKEVIAKLAISERLVYPFDDARGRFVCKRDNLIKLGPAIFFSDLLDWSARAKMLLGGLSKSSLEEKETVYDFFSRKFSSKMADNLVTPLVSGIYAGDPKSLLVRTAFPLLHRADKRCPSLLLGMLKEKSALKKSDTGNDYRVKNGICTFIGGIRDLTLALSEKLAGHLRLHAAAVKLRSIIKDKGFCRYPDARWMVHTADGDNYFCKNLIVTLPAEELSELIFNSFAGDGVGDRQFSDEFVDEYATSDSQKLFLKLFRRLQALHYPWLGVIHLVYAKKDISSRVRGFGFLNVHEQKDRAALGVLFPTYMFPGRCRGPEELFTAFVGGELYPEIASSSPEKIIMNVHQELATVLKINVARPEKVFFFSWPKSIPQFDKYHYAFKDWCVDHDSQLRNLNWNWCANYWGGVSISDCMENAKRVAMEILAS
ncbi:MAG: protoporphyrinogen oxidase [Oligoflexia bacterium]|nr:protoporphyrinogen oxidase [Oligoflexia bacterium]